MKGYLRYDKPPHYVTDPSDFLDENGNVPDDLPGPARKLTLFLGQIIEEMSALPPQKTFLISLGRDPGSGFGNSVLTQGSLSDLFG